MSPEPTQEPIEQNLQAPHVNVDAGENLDSDSDNDDFSGSGYMPLSQIPTDGDNLLDDEEEDEWISAAVNHQSYPLPEEEISEPENPESLQVWSSSTGTTNIDLDADKISQVKSMMATFTLPKTAIPEWANTVSEDLWKDKLIDRIKEIQNRD